LATVSVGAAIRHRHYSSFIMLQTIHQLIREGLAIDTFSALTSVGGIAALHQKLFDVTVEDGTIVGALSTQCQEILTGHWS